MNDRHLIDLCVDQLGIQAVKSKSEPNIYVHTLIKMYFLTSKF